MLFHLLCGHFDEKNVGVPVIRGRVSCQSQRVRRGWMQPGNIRNHYLKKKNHLIKYYGLESYSIQRVSKTMAHVEMRHFDL